MIWYTALMKEKVPWNSKIRLKGEISWGTFSLGKGEGVVTFFVRKLLKLGCRHAILNVTRHISVEFNHVTPASVGFILEIYTETYPPHKTCFNLVMCVRVRT